MSKKTQTFYFPFSLFQNGAHIESFWVGWFKCATNEKVLGFISLVHHLFHLNNLRHSTIFQHIGPMVLTLILGLGLFISFSSPIRLIRDGYGLAPGVGNLSRGPFLSKRPKRSVLEPLVRVLT